MASHQESESSVVLDFVEQLLDDMERGSLLPFAEYCARFPGHDDALAREYERLTVGASPASTSETTVGGAADPTLVESDTTTDELIQRLTGRGLHVRYQHIGEIARGGMGVIDKVWDEDLRRHLAMKVVRGAGRRSLETFIEEAQVTGGLDHPGIVPVHELGVDAQGRVYFTMRLVHGRSLKKIFELVHADREGWTRTRALNVILKVCEAMAYAHSRGVIHRDIKPANVMVGQFGEVYVMDWGLARVMGRADQHNLRLRSEEPSHLASMHTRRRKEREATPDSPLVTMDGDVVGTPSFMAPEQAQGRVDQIGPHTDVYAVGTLLYQLLTGQPPYVGPAEKISPRTVLAMVLQGPPTAIHALADDVPGELVAICDRAMARDPRNRYPNTRVMAEDFEAYIDGRVVAAYETGAVAELRKWVKRNMPLAASLAAGVLALVAGFIVSVSLMRRADANSKLAEIRRVESEKNEREAQRQAGIAKANADLAEERRVIAEANEQAAERGKAHVFRLSAFQTLDDLTEEAALLWPAEPALIARYQAWLARAEQLTAQIPEFRESLLEIEQRALPRGEQASNVQQPLDTRAAETEHARARYLWLSRMLGQEEWPSESSVKAELSQELLPPDAVGLNALAWALVDPEKPVHGAELRALLLARSAVALSSDTNRAMCLDTLAWALFNLGRFDDALAESYRSVNEAGEARMRVETYAQMLEAAVQRWQGAARAERVQERDALKIEVEALEAQLSKRTAFRFADDDDQWWHAQMTKLVSALESFVDERSGLMRGRSAERGGSVAQRLSFASSIEERSVSGPEARTRWREAITAISLSEKYRGTQWPSGPQLAPQLGLVPLGPDPESGLWEFAHLQTGEPAERAADGKLILTPSMGLVFVLIPGGEFVMGAQSTDPAAGNYDPYATSEELPLHEVRLAPYFHSKYEMTQGQWERFMGRNPSQYGPSVNYASFKRGLLHPVEQVSWTQCMDVMRRLGLVLPSEAQWEHACRGGSHSAWWTGAERESLRGKVNLADQAAARARATWLDIQDWPDLDDGWVLHAAVGSFAANPFGLHDVHGNVWEWCLDGYQSGFYARSPRENPVCPSAGARNRVFRGGAYDNAASRARSAHRSSNPPEYEHSDLGLRPARVVAP